jgi:hypothetical protein
MQVYLPAPLSESHASSSFPPPPFPTTPSPFKVHSAIQSVWYLAATEYTLSPSPSVAVHFSWPYRDPGMPARHSAQTQLRKAFSSRVWRVPDR